MTYVWNAGPRPEQIDVYFCSVCGYACGIRDYDRIQHEHFDNSSQCRNGRWDIKTYRLVTPEPVTSERSRPAPTEAQKWTPGQWR